MANGVVCVWTKDWSALVNLWLVLLPLLLTPGQALVVKLPLRQALAGTADQAGRHGDAAGGVKGRARRSPGVTASQLLTGISGEGYYIDLDVGTPPQRMQVLVDTGSSNFALAASPDPHIQQYFNSSASSTYSVGLSSIYVPYTQGEWRGLLGTEDVTLTSLPNVTVRPNIAFISQSTGFFIPMSKWQGIVGLAYKSIARPENLTPFWDSVRDAAELDDLFSMQLCGTAHSHNASGQPAMEGTLVLGGESSELYKGELLYSPIVKEMYYEVIISDMAVSGTSLGLDCKEYNFDKTIVDSGTTHLRLPNLVFSTVVKRIKAELKSKELESTPTGTFWTGEELLCWDDLSKAFDVFPVVSLSLVSSQGHDNFFTLHLSPQHYLRSMNTDVATLGIAVPSRSCLKFGISPSESGTVLGALLMESFFVVFDRANRRMGFAETSCDPPHPDSPSRGPVIDGIHSAKGKNLTGCHYQRATRDDSTLLVVTYVMAAVCLLCALPLLVLAVQWHCRKLARRRGDPRDPEAETVLTDGR